MAAFFDYDYAIGAYRYLVLTPDAPAVESYHHSVCEEGPAHYSERWELDGEIVRYTSCRWGRDCDGAYRQDFESWCPVGELAARTDGTTVDGDPLPFALPAWRAGRSSQRDYSAEAAGY